MAIPSKPSYNHGSTGTEPGSPTDYANGDTLDADNLDYYLSVEFQKIKEIIDALNALDSDDDEKVDAADTADAADNVTGTYKGNDIDSDGDGKVNSADTADDAKRAITDGSAWQIRDTTNATNIFSIAESSGDTSIAGELTENASI